MSDTRLWHPFADMHAVRGAELVIDRGEGAYVWDADGRRYLDGTASLWCVNVGHGRRGDRRRRRRADAHAWRATRRSARSRTRPRCALAERLAELAPVDDAAGLPRLGRRRRDRHRRRSSPAATSPSPASPSACTSSAARRATTAPTGSGTLDRRHPRQPRGHGTAGPERLAGPARLARGARGRVRGASAPTASPRSSSSRSWARAASHQPRPGYVEGVAELCARTGVAVRRRRGHLRLRPPRHVVRRRALRRARPT